MLGGVDGSSPNALSAQADYMSLGTDGKDHQLHFLAGLWEIIDVNVSQRPIREFAYVNDAFDSRFQLHNDPKTGHPRHPAFYDLPRLVALGHYDFPEFLVLIHAVPFNVSAC
jgi:hypothetical protein